MPPSLFISAKDKKRTYDIYKNLLTIQEAFTRRIDTGELNRFIRSTVTTTPPKSVKGKLAKFFYVTQPKTQPPLFLFFVNNAKFVHFSYKRFLENKLREAFDFQGSPIRLSFRGKT